MAILVETATSDDIAELMRVRTSVHENRLSDPARVRPEDVRAMLEERGRGWLVRHGDGRVAGFAIADQRVRNVWALFVEPDAEGRGLGRRLHDTMMDWLFDIGREPVWLSTGPGTRAEGFYRAAGWQHTGETPEGELRFEMTRDRWLERGVKR